MITIFSYNPRKYINFPLSIHHFRLITLLQVITDNRVSIYLIVMIVVALNLLVSSR